MRATGNKGPKDRESTRRSSRRNSKLPTTDGKVEATDGTASRTSKSLNEERSVDRNKTAKNSPADERTVDRNKERTVEQTKDEEEPVENKAELKVRYKHMMAKELPNLIKEEFYHGLMVRDEINDIVKEEGEFLVRKTEVGKGTNLNEKFAITVCWKGRTRHVLLRLDKEDKWYVMKNNKFDSVANLVAFYIKNKSAMQQDGAKLYKVTKRPEWYLLHENIVCGKKLGAGAFGEVFLADMGGTQVAVKTLKGKLGKQERNTFMKEASINRRFNHPNVARLLGVAAQSEPVMVVLEFCAGGQLKSHCKDKPELTIKDLSKYLFEAAQGMEYLSGLDVIHRDLAARNCLLSGDFVCKIADFGLSCTTSEAQEQKKLKMPVKWLAPEILTKMEFSSKTDVYAFGTMMWEVYSRCQSDPYPGMNNADVKKMVLTDKRMDPPAEAPEMGKTLMIACWAPNVANRPTFSGVVEEMKKFPEIIRLMEPAGAMIQSPASASPAPSPAAPAPS